MHPGDPTSAPTTARRQRSWAPSPWPSHMGWSAADMPDCEGTVAVVTGANSGIGRETTRGLARAGVTVVMACRSPERGESAADDVRSDVPDADLAVAELDLADLSSVRDFADRLDRRLDVLVNNAGVMAVPYRETADGFELQFGVNHLGHFALTGHLLDSLAADGRVITVSSNLHRRGRLSIDHLPAEGTGDVAHGGPPAAPSADEYDRWDAYARSKLANLLFATELDRRFRAADGPRDDGRGGTDPPTDRGSRGSATRRTSVAAHPGWAATDLQERGPRMMGDTVRRVGAKVVNRLVAQSAADGALPVLYAATEPDVVGGAYYGPDGFLNLRGPPAEQRPARRAQDRETARRLWTLSEALTGVPYDLPAA